MAGAAFFDLDRTLLRGASGPLITEALIQAGLVNERTLAAQQAIYRVFDVVGETLPSIALARAAAAAAKGWPVAAMRDAGKAAAERLDAIVAPYARPIIDEHRAAGRQLVLATTTPYELIRPLAQRLAFDDVIATRYAHTDGVLTGALDGGFVWSQGKLAAVRAWADEHGVDLADSYAYSDSIYDTPLLSAVGHPFAVNPDPRLALFAAVRRWPVLHLDVPAGIPKIMGLEPADLLKLAARPELIRFARFDIAGTDKIPRTGPAIIVANHRSYFDTVALGMTILRAGRSPRFLGKKEVFDAPVVGQVASALGGIRVDRGTGSAEPLRRAAEALEAGEAVALMPQGTIPRGEAFFDPVLKGRYGVARLAAMTRAPVIPVGLWGTEKVWPRAERMPRVWNVLRPPKVTVRVGDPVDLSYDDEAADVERVMAAIVALLPPEARERRTPTEEELRLAKPPS
ncbi:MAG TPA: HAD-IB family hydrolase [Acidimicrobiales bacterium]|nr:HAD-IB family hydrolase [Acidimicrobiales bacterium]